MVNLHVIRTKRTKYDQNQCRGCLVIVRKRNIYRHIDRRTDRASCPFSSKGEHNQYQQTQKVTSAPIEMQINTLDSDSILPNTQRVVVLDFLSITFQALSFIKPCVVTVTNYILKFAICDKEKYAKEGSTKRLKSTSLE